MVTANKIISDIRNIATSGSNPIDFRIEDAQIQYWIDEIRSMLIAQSLEKKDDINDSWILPINCLDLIEVDKSECCEVTTNCKVLRTQEQIPSTIDTVHDNSIVRVEDISGNILSKTTAFESKYNNYNKYTTDKTKWYLKNNYIYIINSQFLNKINVYGLWEIPSDLSNYVNCDGNTCYDINSFYPISLKMASDITNIVLKTKIYPFMSMPQDNTNDSSNTLDRLPTKQ